MKFVRLAELFPSEKFVMIGGRPTLGDGELFDEVKQKVLKIPNLEFLGFQPFHVTEKYFDRCKVFVNTSTIEGFPNTFLQAWSRGIPVISYVDPDDVIQKNDLGIVVTSEEELHRALGQYLSIKVWQPKKIVRYFLSNHFDGVIDRYESFFSSLVSKV